MQFDIDDIDIPYSFYAQILFFFTNISHPKYGTNFSTGLAIYCLASFKMDTKGTRYIRLWTANSTGTTIYYMQIFKCLMLSHSRKGRICFTMQSFSTNIFLWLHLKIRSNVLRYIN
jgi:hypothetical protein